MRHLVFVLIIALFSAPAFASGSNMQMSGASFSNACTKAGESWISFCNGYIQAVIDGLQKGDNVCLPAGTTRTEIVTIAEREITSSKRLQKMNAQDAVRLVIRRHYQCE